MSLNTFFLRHAGIRITTVAKPRTGCEICACISDSRHTQVHMWEKSLKNRTENLKLDCSLQVKLCRFFIFDHSIHLRLLLRGRDRAFPCECKLLLIDYQVTRTSTGNTGARYKLIFVITPDHLGKQSHLIIAVNRVSAFIQVHTWSMDQNQTLDCQQTWLKPAFPIELKNFHRGK